MSTVVQYFGFVGKEKTSQCAALGSSVHQVCIVFLDFRPLGCSNCLHGSPTGSKLINIAETCLEHVASLFAFFVVFSCVFHIFDV